MTDLERLKAFHDELIRLLSEEQAILNAIIDMLPGANR